MPPFRIAPGPTAIAAGVLALAILAVQPTRAQTGVNPAVVSDEDRQACTPDVFRVCRAAIPDQAAIQKCLVYNIDAISPACRSVLRRARQ